MRERRDFLSLLGLTVAGGLAGTRIRAQERAPQSEKKDAVIIGAGLAGLAAARELSRRDWDVVVLEARDRIGGRIHTSAKWADAPLDLGATWIHGVQGNPLTALADEIRAKRIATRYDRSVAYAAKGERLSAAQEKRVADLKGQVFKALKEAQRRDEDVSIRQAVESLRRRFPESSEDRRIVDFVISADIEQEYSGSAADLSAHWFDGSREFEGDDALFPNGFHAVVEHLARDLSIELGQVVQRIEWGTAPARVITQEGEFVADHVLVTLPLGVLKAGRVEFDPELPREKRSAIVALGFGVLNKCFLRFERAFWPDDIDWIEHLSAKPGEWTEWVSFQRAVDLPILLGFNAAGRGKEIEAWSDAEIVASAMETLRTILGRKIPSPIDHQITRWASDPFSLGAYSFHAVGSTPKTRAHLASPLADVVFFAGEATEQDYSGTAHGAYLSGIRAAKEMLAT